mmetsp:Transcript_28886/g.55048  ORF Transcript_28886/g.55048 Transcript_28886/m.55048 type:complete len:359 (+) Transcript_28886:677-1753(+)
MTTIYIDTNIFMNESFFRSSLAQAFLKSCALLQVTVVVPDVVVDEVLGNFPKKLKEKASAYQKARRELIRLIDLDPFSFDLSEEVDDYEEWLLELIENNGVEIAPYPEVSTKELVSKSYEGKKPFKESGEGHKDYLVWKTVAAHINAQSSTPPNILLTNNIKDFCTSDGEESVLHPDLSVQIDNEQNKPKIYTSLKSAFDDLLAPNLQGVTFNEIPELGADEIQEMVNTYLLDDLPDHTAFGFEGVPFSNDVSITGVDVAEITETQLTKVDDEVVINVSGTVGIEVSGFIDKHAYYMDAEGGLDISVDDANWNDHVMAVSATVDTAFEIRLFYSFEDKEISSYEISLPQEIEDDWPYK